MLEKEKRVYEFLQELEMEYEVLHHEPLDTVDSCALTEKELNAPICKNLFLCNTQRTKFYMLMMEGHKKFQTSIVSKQINSPRLSFAEETYMEEFLDILPGSVSVMGLMNDHKNKVQLLVDKEIKEWNVLGCHPCINTSTLKIKTKDLFDRFLPRVGHTPIFVDIE